MAKSYKLITEGEYLDYMHILHSIRLSELKLKKVYDQYEDPQRGKKIQLIRNLWGYDNLNGEEGMPIPLELCNIARIDSFLLKNLRIAQEKSSCYLLHDKTLQQCKADLEEGLIFDNDELGNPVRILYQEEIQLEDIVKE